MGMDRNIAFMPQGTEWRKHRRIMQQNFRLDTLATHHPIQLRRVHVMLKGLLESPERFQYHNKVLSMSIPMASMYGYDVESLDDPFIARAERAINLEGPLLGPTSTLINMIPALGRIPAWVPGATGQKIALEVKNIQHKLRTEPMELVRERVREGVAIPSVFSNFVEEKLGTSHYEEEAEVIGEVAVTIYSGASDTTISATGTLLYVLAVHPEIQRKAQAEIDRVVGQDRLPNFEDRPSLPYIDAMYRELLRWRPPTPLGIPHCVREDDHYKGYFIPKGAVIFSNIWAMTHNENVYADPYTFKPERFITENGELNEDNRVLTYGFGRRICAGKHVASSTMWLVIASLLACFDIGKAKDEFGKEIEIADDFEDITVTSHKKPFQCSIVPRSETARRLIEEAVAKEKLPSF
ncbi:cytochrome P450 [Flammula alnicola]|nr:cytochrome P450 [Flammula alnicola]